MSSSMSLRDHSRPDPNLFASPIDIGEDVELDLHPDWVEIFQKDVFLGLPNENVLDHLERFNRKCILVKKNGVSEHVVKLMLFPLTLGDGAERWLYSHPPSTFSTWDDLAQAFLTKYFPPSKTAKLRNEIFTFQQGEFENLSEASERLNELLRACPHHGIPIWLITQTFFNNLHQSVKELINASAGGAFDSLGDDEARSLLEKVAKTDDNYGFGRVTRLIEPQVEVDSPSYVHNVQHYRVIPPPTIENDVHAFSYSCDTCGYLGHDSCACSLYASSPPMVMNVMNNEDNMHNVQPYHAPFHPMNSIHVSSSNYVSCGGFVDNFDLCPSYNPQAPINDCLISDVDNLHIFDHSCTPPYHYAPNFFPSQIPPPLNVNVMHELTPSYESCGDLGYDSNACLPYSYSPLVNMNVINDVNNDMHDVPSCHSSLLPMNVYDMQAFSFNCEPCGSFGDNIDVCLSSFPQTPMDDYMVTDVDDLHVFNTSYEPPHHFSRQLSCSLWKPTPHHVNSKLSSNGCEVEVMMFECDYGLIEANCLLEEKVVDQLYLNDHESLGREYVKRMILELERKNDVKDCEEFEIVDEPYDEEFIGLTYNNLDVDLDENLVLEEIGTPTLLCVDDFISEKTPWDEYATIDISYEEERVDLWDRWDYEVDFFEEPILEKFEACFCVDDEFFSSTDHLDLISLTPLLEYVVVEYDCDDLFKEGDLSLDD
ncbi:uncharacterized protein LOC141608319 [Silene latifolia]|uniref:uncharacterized protein LOC141608319 n=1 Tax=Silene latifolia TaxID=37657 RepID=UPI003D775500